MHSEVMMLQVVLPLGLVVAQIARKQFSFATIESLVHVESVVVLVRLFADVALKTT